MAEDNDDLEGDDSTEAPLVTSGLGFWIKVIFFFNTVWNTNTSWSNGLEKKIQEQKISQFLPHFFSFAIVTQN